jgi:hypothetical protein
MALLLADLVWSRVKSPHYTVAEFTAADGAVYVIHYWNNRDGSMKPGTLYDMWRSGEGNPSGEWCAINLDAASLQCIIYELTREGNNEEATHV